MHPRNPYSTPPDFSALATSYPPLKQYVKSINGVPALDFKDVNAQRCLTQAILHRDFGLSLSLPDGRLCPPIPNRLNYLLWLEDIIASPSARGIDIGTGASAIYALLGCSGQLGWSFIATGKCIQTEVDPTSLQYALLNVANNNLQGRIHVVPASKNKPIFDPLLSDPNLAVDFTMCNPPFYSSQEDMRKSAAGKERLPNAVFTGGETEMITEGGETQFVGQMVAESLAIRERCRWYTSLLGKMSSVADLVTLFKTHKIDNYGITELVQGQTRRWAVVWSYGDVRLPDSLARKTSDSLRPSLPLSNILRQSYTDSTLMVLWPALQTVLASIPGLNILLSPPQDNVNLLPHSLRVSAAVVTWTRSARRKNNTAQQNEGPAISILDVVISGHQIEVKHPVLEATWVRGRDRTVFEGFWSHVSRKVTSALEL